MLEIEMRILSLYVKNLTTYVSKHFYLAFNLINSCFRILITDMET